MKSINHRKVQAKKGAIPKNQTRVNHDSTDLALHYDFALAMPKAVEIAAKKIHANKDVISKASRQRKDLHKVAFVTIDGPTAQDFDDALHCTKQGSEFILTVAIADVSFFVKQGDELDEEAAKRATSVYFPDQVLPMLPTVLSNDLCSLVPRQERLALACRMTISEQGKVLNSDFFECSMRSAGRLTYLQVQQMLEQGLQKSEIEQSIAILSELCSIMVKNRVKRGGLMIDLPRPNPVLRDGKLHKIELEDRFHSHKIVEECMLLANICAAEFLQRNNYPFLYRIHPKPPKEKLDRLRDILHDIKIPAPNLNHPKSLQKIIDSVASFEPLIASVLTINIVRTLERATYTPSNIGHFGLGYESYTHFTSPIRRYPDLLVHRAIKAVLHKRKPHNGLGQKLVAIGVHCTERELAAERAALNHVSRLICRTLEGKVGNVRDGVISGMSKGGMFISFGDGTEGMLRFRSLGDDYYELSQNMTRAVGRRRGQSYHVGLSIQVRIKEVNLQEGKCQLALA